MQDISLHILDIIQNSIRAMCNNIYIGVSVTEKIKFLTITIEDDGLGMDEETLNKVTDPFYTTRDTRKIGLGIPLLQYSSKLAGGTFSIKSAINKGTSLTATFDINSVDRIPLGNLGETLSTVIASYPHVRFTLKMCNETKKIIEQKKAQAVAEQKAEGQKPETITLDSFELKKILGDVPLSNYDVIDWIKEYINDGIKLLFGGVLYEINS